jgi:hypothetical protein
LQRQEFSSEQIATSRRLIGGILFAFRSAVLSSRQNPHVELQEGTIMPTAIDLVLSVVLAGSTIVLWVSTVLLLSV